MLSPEPSRGADLPRFLASDLLTRAGLPHLFSTRHFPGVRAWRDPRGPFAPGVVDLLRAERIGREPVAFLRQIHGAEVIATEQGGLVGQADIVTTDRPGLPLAIFTADCLPIIVFDPANHRLAMAHAGWRGTVDGAARAAVGALVRAGGAPEGFLAAIGPSIGPCCYEVDEPVTSRLAAAFPTAWRDWITPTKPGKWHLDLWRANERQLSAAGMRPTRIDNAHLCTACRSDLFFSYRRGRGEGRLVAIAALPDGAGPAC